MKEIEELLQRQKSDLDGFVKKAGSDIIEAKEYGEKLALRVDQLEAKLNRPAGGSSDREGNREGKSIGTMLTSSEDYLDWAKKGAANRMRFQVNGPILQKAAIDTTFDGGTRWTTNLPGINVAPRQRLRVRDLIPSRPVDLGSATQYLRHLTTTGTAGMQVETQAKSELAMTFKLDTAVYRTVAAWLPVSKQALDDVDEMRRVVDDELLYQLDLKVEQQVLAGDAVGENLGGIIPSATAYQFGRDVAGDTVLDTTSHAFTQLEESDYTPTGLILHPRDMERARLLKTQDGGTNTGSYIFGDPAAAGGRTMWNTPVAVSRSITQGTFLAGDFQRGALVLDRQQSTIDISESHDDYFGRNLVAIRAECRIALVIFRTGAFVQGQFPSA